MSINSDVQISEPTSVQTPCVPTRVHGGVFLPSGGTWGPAALFAVKPWAAKPAASTVLGQTTQAQPNIRKQYVHMTRVNAGGDGASGPHPEREPA